MHDEVRIRTGKSCAAVDVAKEQLDFDFFKDDFFSLIRETRDGVTRVKKLVQYLKDFSNLDEAVISRRFAACRVGRFTALNRKPLFQGLALPKVWSDTR